MKKLNDIGERQRNNNILNIYYRYRCVKHGLIVVQHFGIINGFIRMISPSSAMYAVWRLNGRIHSNVIRKCISEKMKWQESKMIHWKKLLPMQRQLNDDMFVFFILYYFKVFFFFFFLFFFLLMIRLKFIISSEHLWRKKKKKLISCYHSIFAIFYVDDIIHI